MKIAWSFYLVCKFITTIGHRLCIGACECVLNIERGSTEIDIIIDDEPPKPTEWNDRINANPIKAYPNTQTNQINKQTNKQTL